MENVSGNDGHDSKMPAYSAQQEVNAKDDEERVSGSSGSSVGHEDMINEEGVQQGDDAGVEAKTDESPTEISVPSFSSVSSRNESRAKKRRRREDARQPLRAQASAAASSSVAGGTAGLLSAAAAASNLPYRVVAHSSRGQGHQTTGTQLSSGSNRLATAARRRAGKQRREQERRKRQGDHQREFAQQVSRQLLELERTFNEAREQATIGEASRSKSQLQSTDGAIHNCNQNNSPPATGAAGSDSRTLPTNNGYEADEETISSGDAGIKHSSSDEHSEKEDKGS